MTMNLQPSNGLPRNVSRIRVLCTSFVQWLDADFVSEGAEAARCQSDKIDWMRCLPFIALHVGCLGVVFTGWSVTSLAVAAGLYFIRMFAVTGIYHRYFSHKTYRTSRDGQFFLAL